MGNIDQLNDVLSHLIYYPNALSLYSTAMSDDDDDDGKDEAVIPDYVVTIVTKDANTDAAEIEAPVLIHLINDPPQFICSSDDTTSPMHDNNIHVMSSASSSSCLPLSLYTLEDEVLSIGSTISIYDDSYPTSASQSIGLLGVNLSVLHGDLFLGSHRDIFFSSSANITGQLSFVGSISAVNTALSSLLYVPTHNWNSGR